MSQINNSDLTKELIQGAKINTSFDSVPNQIAEKVVPVMECNPKLLRRSKTVFRSNTASGTVLTTSSVKDTFITGFNAVATNSTAATTGSFYVTITEAETGAQRLFTFSLPCSNLIDVQEDSIALSLPFPIRLLRGSTIATTCSGLSAAVVTIFYYEDDVTSA